MKRTLIISYEWWDAGEPSKEISKDVIELLEKNAEERIDLQIKEGFTSGELFANIYKSDDDYYDGDDEGEDYRGSWKLERRNQ